MNELEEGIWGKHLIVDAHNCDSQAINDPKVVAEFAKTLVERIDMVAYGEPQVIYFGSGDKAGLTLIQLIETSNINAHFVPTYQCAFIDVFSCKNFDEKVVMDTIFEFFKSNQCFTETVYRTNSLIQRISQLDNYEKVEFETLN